MKWIKLMGFALCFSLFYSFVVYQFSKLFQIVVGVDFGNWDAWLINFSALLLLVRIVLSESSLKNFSPSRWLQSRTKLSPQQPPHGPRTIEALDAAFRTPETARDLCLFLMETGQIPLDENTPPTAKAFDQFFGAKPMSKEDRMRYEGIVAKAQEE